MYKKALGSIVAAATLMTTGCATILTEDTHKINVSTSNGMKTEVSVDGKTQQVPGIVVIKKENEDKVLVASDDSCTKETNLNKEVEPTFFINVLSGGVLGSTTDMASKKMWKYQDSVTITCN